MNIGLTNEYCPPFAPSGAEWSVLALAGELGRAARAEALRSHDLDRLLRMEVDVLLLTARSSRGTCCQDVRAEAT